MDASPRSLACLLVACLLACDATVGTDATPQQRSTRTTSPGRLNRAGGGNQRRRLLPSTPGGQGRGRDGEDADDIAELDDALREEFLDINPSKRYHLATLFHAVNVDGDKFVTVSELKDVLNDPDLGGILGSLRSHLRSASDSFLTILLQQLDRDGDGHLTIYEFSVAFADMMNDDGVHVPHRGLYAAQLFALEAEFELLEDELCETREELQQEKRQIKTEREHTSHDVEALRADADHTEEIIEELELQLQLANQRLANSKSHERSLTLALEKTDTGGSSDSRSVVCVGTGERDESAAQPYTDQLHGEKKRFAELQALYDELLEQSGEQSEQVAREQTVPFEQYSEVLQSLNDTCDTLDAAEEIDHEKSEQLARLGLELQQRDQSIAQLRQILLGLSASLAGELGQPLERLGDEASIEDFEDGFQDQLLRVLERLAQRQPDVASNIGSPELERKDSAVRDIHGASMFSLEQERNALQQSLAEMTDREQKEAAQLLALEADNAKLRDDIGVEQAIRLAEVAAEHQARLDELEALRASLGTQHRELEATIAGLQLKLDEKNGEAGTLAASFVLLDALGKICDMTTAICDPAHRASVSGAGTSVVDRIIANIARIQFYFVSITEQSATIAALFERDAAASPGSGSGTGGSIPGVPVDGGDIRPRAAGPSFTALSETLAVVTSRITGTLVELRAAVDRTHQLDLQLELEAQNREAQIDPLEAKVAGLQANLDRERQACAVERETERQAREAEVAALEEKLRELEAFGDSLAAVNTRLEAQVTELQRTVVERDGTIDAAKASSVEMERLLSLRQDALHSLWDAKQAAEERAELAESVAAAAAVRALADEDELDTLMQQISDMRAEQKKEKEKEKEKEAALRQTIGTTGDLLASLGSIAGAAKCLATRSSKLVEGHAAQGDAIGGAMQTAEHMLSFEPQSGSPPAAQRDATIDAVDQFAANVVGAVLDEVFGLHAPVADNTANILCDLGNVAQNFGQIEARFGDFDLRLQAADSATKIQEQLADKLDLEVAAADAKLEAASLEIDMLRQKLKVMEIQQQIHNAAEQIRDQGGQGRGASLPDVEAQLKTMSAALQVSRQVSKALREKVESEQSLSSQHTRALKVIAKAIKSVAVGESPPADLAGSARSRAPPHPPRASDESFVLSILRPRDPKLALAPTPPVSPPVSDGARIGDQADQDGEQTGLERTIMSGVSGIRLKMESLQRNLNTLTLKLEALEMQTTQKKGPAPTALGPTQVPPALGPASALAPSPAQGVLSRLRKSISAAQAGQAEQTEEATSVESNGLVKKLRRELKIALADLRSVQLELRLLTLKHATTFDEACTNAYGLHAF